MVYRKESVIKRIGKLREYAIDLRVFAGLTSVEFKSSKIDRYAVERILFLIAECIIDVLDHHLSARHGVVSESYEDVIENALVNGVIDADLYGKLKGLGGFRNVLAHGYLAVNTDEVHRHMLKMLSIIDAVIATFERMLVD